MSYPGDKTSCALRRLGFVLIALGFVLIACGVLIALSGCGGGIGWSWPWESTAPITGADGKPVTLGPRDQFAHLLGQLQWIFLGLGIAAFVASIWIPLISTRHAVGSIFVGAGIALIKPWLVALYWPTIIILGISALAAAWPYLIAAYTWVWSRFTGKPIDPAKLTTGFATLATLWKPRGAVLADSRRADGSLGVDGVSSPPTNGGAS